jgi:hypothetical protein
MFSQVSIRGCVVHVHRDGEEESECVGRDGGEDAVADHDREAAAGGRLREGPRDRGHEHQFGGHLERLYRLH